MSTIENFNKHIMPTYGRYDVVMDTATGVSATDEVKNVYIDFGSGIGVNSLGYCDNDWVEAVCEQARTLNHTSNYYYTKVQSDFATKLCEITNYSKIFFANSGAEANECAIKIARKYNFDKFGKGHHNIITLRNSFHGRTMATISATAQDEFHNFFFPFLGGFISVVPNDINHLKSKIDNNVCAVMIELIQGEGGVNVLDKDYVLQLSRLCEEKNILLIVDEVQTGVGRTGTFLASEQYGIQPDITTLAKGIAGGLPMGICMTKSNCDNILTAGTHGSTFGGNPICCAGGLVVLDKVSDKKFLSDVNAKGEFIREKLSKNPEISEINGLGLMLGITLKSKNAKEIAKKCLESGLLVLTAKDKLRLLPPLNISYNDLETGIKILQNVLSGE